MKFKEKKEHVTHHPNGIVEVGRTRLTTCYYNPQ